MPRKTIDVPRLFEMWAKGVHQSEICEELDIRPGSFWTIKKRHALPPRPVDRTIDFSHVEPPTEEEIAERAAAVRAAWSEEEREKRIVGNEAYRPRLRSYSLSPRNLVVTAMD